jgi:hypothetical protein
MTVSSPNVTEIKLDRLIDDMRLLRSRMVAFDRHLIGIEAYLKAIEASLKAIEPSEKKSKSTPSASASARTVLFTVGAAVGAALTKFYLAT